MRQADVLRRIERHLKTSREAPSAFGKRALGDSNLVFQLRLGRSPSLKTVEKVMDAIPPRRRRAVHCNNGSGSE